MADDVKVTNWPKDNGAGSPAAVALELLKYTRLLEGSKPSTFKQALDLYAECLEATQGRRGYDPIKNL